MTHSPTMVNLKIIDLRGVPMKSARTVKLRPHEFKAVNLSELYLEFDERNSKKLDDIDISFFFTGMVSQLSKLVVLHIAGRGKQLFMEGKHIDKEACHNKRKLTLINVFFEDNIGRKILNELINCEELSLQK
jgi:hypothetical protein